MNQGQQRRLGRSSHAQDLVFSDAQFDGPDHLNMQGDLFFSQSCIMFLV